MYDSNPSFGSFPVAQAPELVHPDSGFSRSPPLKRKRKDLYPDAQRSEQTRSDVLKPRLPTDAYIDVSGRNNIASPIYRRAFGGRVTGLPAWRIRQRLDGPGLEVFLATNAEVAPTAARLAPGKYTPLEEYESLGEPQVDVPAADQLDATIEKYLLSHPEDVDKWIAYATGIAERDHSLGHSRRALSEAALATLARAIEAHPANARSAILQIAYMRAARRVLKAKNLISKWEVLLSSPHGFVFSEISSLWLEYLDYMETTGSLFDALDAYGACLARLPQSADTADPLEEYQIYIVLRCSMLLKRAGYPERALAIFQALIEINTGGTEPFNDRLARFADFWKSDAPRIGDDGGTGWEHACGMREGSPDPVGTVEDWAVAERTRAHDLPIPLRKSTTDPDRYVLYRDIQPFLFPIRHIEGIAYALAVFLGFRAIPDGAPTTSIGIRDPHVYDGPLFNRSLRDFWRDEQLSADTGHQVEVAIDRDCPNSCALSAVPDIKTTDLSHINVDLARHMMNRLRRHVRDAHFTVFCLAFESAAFGSKAANLLAKNVLASNSEEMELWAGYAELERRRGRVASARKILATALRGFYSETLLCQLAWLELEHGDALPVVLSPPHRSLLEASSPTLVLRAKQHYMAVQDAPTGDTFALSMIFIYLTEGSESAAEFMDRRLSELLPGSASLERAYQDCVRLFRFDRQRRSAPTGALRKLIERAMHDFPDNTMFLTSYMWLERAARIHGRVQRRMANLIHNGTIFGLLWALWAEPVLAGPAWKDQAAARIRDRLSKSVEACPASASLWRIYIDFEIVMEQPDRAKRLCYRSVTAIPFCKELWLLPFDDSLSASFSNKEKREWCDAMLARGIRVNLPVETYLQTSTEEGETSLPEDEPLIEDELRFLSDRKALLPY